jgi:hypothetical protein
MPTPQTRWPTPTWSRTTAREPSGYSLTENLTRLAEGSDVKSKSQAGGNNTATTVNTGAFFKF